MPDDETRISPPQMLAAAARLLRPLVRVLIRVGVTFPVLVDLLRSLYVDEADAELAASAQPRTDSRVSLLTGIHRKELRRQRLEPAGRAEPDVVTLNSRLIGRWLGDPAFTEADGSSLPLPRTGPVPSFEALVTGVTKDVHPRSILDGWLAQGVVAMEADGRVRLRASAFLPGEASEAALFYFARNLHDHVAASGANILSSRPPFLDRSVHYDGLSRAAADRLEAVAREAAERTLLHVNRAALRIAAEDGATSEVPRRRINLGVFVFAADEPDAP